MLLPEKVTVVGTFGNTLAGETREALACRFAIEQVALEVARAEHVVGRWLRRVAEACIGPRYAAVAVGQKFSKVSAEFYCDK